jgi:hypothetical protein
MVVFYKLESGGAMRRALGRVDTPAMLLVISSLLCAASLTSWVISLVVAFCSSTNCDYVETSGCTR